KYRYAAIGRDAQGQAVVGSVHYQSTADRELDSRELVEGAALTVAARALIAAAAEREESRGCHVRTDFTERDDPGWQRSQVVRLNPSGQPVLADPVVARGVA
ncbi:L-aspartate oxidase, partial [Actinosynnema sp. NPDC023658]